MVRSIEYIELLIFCFVDILVHLCYVYFKSECRIKLLITYGAFVLDMVVDSVLSAFVLFVIVGS
jgi:hypothetical protein